MGSVVKKVIFSRKTLTLFIIFCLYFAAGFTFFHFGLKEAVSAEDTYALEASLATSRLNIAKIDLDIPVENVEIRDNNLEVPAQIVGKYSVHENKTLLIGHSTTAFSNLGELKLGDNIILDDKTYKISDIRELEKSAISMKEILKAEDKDTLVLMTCAGKQITETDFSHRLIITAS